LLSSCLRADPGPVGLTGLDTSGDLSAVLHFVNPFAQDAILALQIASALGIDTPGDLESVRVPAGTHIEVPLTRPLSGRQAISVEALATSGLAAMGAIGSGTSDLTGTEARPGALQWAFPVPATALGGELHLRSVSDLIGDFRIDRLEAAGVTEGVAEGLLNPGEQVVVPLSEVLTAPGGLAVAATEPLVAGLVLDRAAGRLTVAGGAPATRWVVPVTVPLGQATTFLWVLNLGSEAATVSLSPLTAGAGIDQVTMEAGSLAEITLPDLEGGGLLVEGDQPMVVVVAVAQGEAVAATLASPLE
ncbi:MAG TPA: hypothetical protein VJR05_04595, partial [Acidimicrobiia bacterium]|nr:hypothetical protein [Acidimicrobiia bacterium]